VSVGRVFCYFGWLRRGEALEGMKALLPEGSRAEFEAAVKEASEMSRPELIARLAAIRRTEPRPEGAVSPAILNWLSHGREDHQS
jgi:hypothetical protein